jgi:hypothetical protein
MHDSFLAAEEIKSRHSSRNIVDRTGERDEGMRAVLDLWQVLITQLHSARSLECWYSYRVLRNGPVLAANALISTVAEVAVPQTDIGQFGTQHSERTIA